MKKHKLTLYDIFVYTALFLVIAYIYFQLIAPSNFEEMRQAQYFVVVTDSMEPTIPVNSLIRVNKSDRDFEVDDIVSVFIDVNNDEAREIVTHRIASIHEESGTLRTMSDHFREIDRWVVKKTDVIGKVELIIPHVGWLAMFLQRNVIVFIILAIIGVMIYLYILINNWHKQ